MPGELQEAGLGAPNLADEQILEDLDHFQDHVHYGRYHGDRPGVGFHCESNARYFSFDSKFIRAVFATVIGANLTIHGLFEASVLSEQF